METEIQNGHRERVFLVCVSVCVCVVVGADRRFPNFGRRERYMS